MNLIEYYKKVAKPTSNARKSTCEITICNYSASIQKKEDVYISIDELMLKGTNKNAVFSKKRIRISNE